MQIINYKQFQEIQNLIKIHKIKFLDLRYTDTLAKEHHVTLSIDYFNEDLIKYGHPFDGSSIMGWQKIESSDMILMPDLTTIKFDPFYEHPTLFVICNVFDPRVQEAYNKCPRGVARRAEEFLLNSAIADTAYFGPEAEFFIFDSISWNIAMNTSHIKISSDEGAWLAAEELDGCNIGHRPMIKGGYVPLPPVDSMHDLRSEICLVSDELGIKTEMHHHEVATAGQLEIGTKYSTLLNKADQSQTFKYIVKNVAHKFGKTATFMPKPLYGDNGSGMHVHQSLWRDGKNLFSGDKYNGLSELALYYIGGIIKHAKALNAITNPTTNSYKRLVPGFEAPVILTYASSNRSAAIRVPYTKNINATRVEVRFPDGMANPYLAFSAMLMAGIDGVINKIMPSDAMDINLYELNKQELASIPKVASNLEEAIAHLDQDREFLLRGHVFNNELIDSFIALKQDEVSLHNSIPNPIEFQMYYSV